MRRRAGESFLVGDGVEIEVLEILGTRVKLGIVAPDSVLIQRKEIKITREENITAARSVRRPDVSSLISKVVASRQAAAPVNKLTDASIWTGEITEHVAEKILERPGPSPDMCQ